MSEKIPEWADAMYIIEKRNHIRRRRDENPEGLVILPRFRVWYKNLLRDYDEYSENMNKNNKIPLPIEEYAEVYECHVESRENYNKYLEDTIDEMTYDEWVDIGIMKGYASYLKEIEKYNISQGSEGNYHEIPLDPSPYLTHVRTQKKYERFGGKTKRLKRSNRLRKRKC